MNRFEEYEQTIAKMKVELAEGKSNWKITSTNLRLAEKEVLNLRAQVAAAGR